MWWNHFFHHTNKKIYCWNVGYTETIHCQICLQFGSGMSNSCRTNNCTREQFSNIHLLFFALCTVILCIYQVFPTGFRFFILCNRVSLYHSSRCKYRLVVSKNLSGLHIVQHIPSYPIVHLHLFSLVKGWGVGHINYWLTIFAIPVFEDTCHGHLTWGHTLCCCVSCFSLPLGSVGAHHSLPQFAEWRNFGLGYLN